MTSQWNQAKLNEREAYQSERRARNPQRTPSRTLTNATTSGTYTGNTMQSPRAEADQHFQYPSAGYQAQIRRV